MRTPVVWTALAAAGPSILLIMSVHAQTAAPRAAADTTQPSVAETQLSEVTVTGSRIITNGNDAPTPVTVVVPEQLTATKPTTVFENLAILPMFSGSGGAGNAPDNIPNSNGAVSALNLRNLGALRSLTLLDGHRVPPTTADGLVDINMIPQMLLQRVDVVTGGASAVYGSDAVTGVINFIPDRKFNGVKVDLHGGISTFHDDESYRIGLAAGTNLFDNRAHIEASYERYDSQGIPFRSARSWTNGPWSLQGDGSAGDPWHLQDNVRIGNVTFGGVIVCAPNNPNTIVPGQSKPFLCPGEPLVGNTFNTNGILTPMNHGSSTGVSYPFLQVGGDGAYHSGVSLQSAARQDQMFGRFDYQLTDDLHAFIMGSGAADRTIGYAGSLRSFPPGWYMGSCNAFLAAQYQQALGCTSQSDPNQPTFMLSRMYNPPDSYGLAQQNEIWVHNYFAMTGLEGKFAQDYHWDATYTHSQSTTNVRGNENQSLSHLYAALDAVTDPSTGKTVCNVTLTNPGLYPGCVPINPFGPTAPSQQALAYVFGRIETLSKNSLDDISADISGAPFHDWAGPVKIALSGEVRRASFEMSSTSLPDQFVDCAPLRFGNCQPDATTYFINTNAPRSPVHQTVSEGAIEFDVPLLTDAPFARDVRFNSAARYAHYDNSSGGDPSLPSTSFNAATWKAGITWTATDWVTFRWARSHDFRAPNLYDLYNPIQLIPNNQVSDYLVLDPSSGQPSNVNPVQQFGGNPRLKPEQAYTTTLGVVFHPNSQFSMALDAYDIRIRDALVVIDGSTQFIQQACIASGGTSPLCALQVRPFGCCSNTTVANTITRYVVEPFNIASQKTWGVDVETNYNTHFNSYGFAVRGLVTWQPHLDYQEPGIAFNDQAGAAYNETFLLQPAPVWKASLFLHFDVPQGIALDLAERYRSGLRWSADPTQYSIGGVPSVEYTDATLSYTLTHPVMQRDAEFSVYFNVQNLFNKQPPVVPNPQNAIFPGIIPLNAVGDDVAGRYYTLGVRARF